MIESEKMLKKIRRIRLFDESGLDRDAITSLRLMIIAVAFGVVQFNVVTGIAMAGYLRELGLSDFLFGLMYAIGPLFAPLQLFASYVLEITRARKTIFLVSGIVQRLLWIPFGLVPFFVPMEFFTLRIWIVALFLLVSATVSPFLNVSFFSMAADIVPERIRGRYFAARSRISTVLAILAGFTVAYLLDTLEGFNSYAVVFAIAGVCGTLDILCFIGVKPPPMPVLSKAGGSFKSILKGVFSNKRYMRFILFMTLWMFSINFSGPFILVHLREGVALNATLTTLAVQILPNICSVIVLAKWGGMLDKYGNKAVMRAAVGLHIFAPFLWIFTSNNSISIFFIMFIGAASGFLIPAFDLGANNIMLGNAPKENRSMYFAMYFMLTAIIGAGLANAMGGWMLDNIFIYPEALELKIFGSPLTRYNFILAASAVMRFLLVFVAMPRLVEDAESIKPMEVIKQTARDVKRVWNARIVVTKLYFKRARK